MDDEDTDLAYCPNCGREVYEFAEKCPYCGEWITPVYRSPRRTRWRRIFVLIVVALVIYGLLWRFFW